MRKIPKARTPVQQHAPPAHRASYPMLWWLGWLLVGTGVVCNEWVLTPLLSLDGLVEVQNRVALWLFDLACIAIGLSCVKLSTRLPAWELLRHLHHTYPRTLAFAFGFVLSVLMVMCAEGIFYGLNHYRPQEKAVEEISWIRIPSPSLEDGGSAHPPQRVRGWSIADRVLGYRLPPNAQVTHTLARGGKHLYQGTSTTNSSHRRVTPMDHPEQRHDFLLFFGCSMIFGQGVNDDETMPFYAGQYASHYRPYNYGVPGYGPHHMLAQLQQGELPKDIPEKRGIALYTFIDDHIARAIGAMRVYGWDWSGPFYTLDAHDRLVRQGTFRSGRPFISFLYWVMRRSQIFTYYHITFPLRIQEEHIRRTARIIAEARQAFQQQFHSDAFYVLLYPGAERGQEIIPYLERMGVQYLDYSRLIEWPHPEMTLADGGHPTARGHRTVAAQLVKDLGLRDPNAGL